MKWDYQYPRGPRSCPSYVVSSRHHLIDPIRPTRGHIAISPHGGLSGSALPKFPQSASRGARISGLPGLRYVAACQVARPPVTDRTGSPQHQRAFTSRLSADRSPSLPLDITTAWTGLLVLAGLSPARIAASLAAPDPYVPNSGIRLLPRVSDGKALLRPRKKDSRLKKPVISDLLDPLPRD